MPIRESKFKDIREDFKVARLKMSALIILEKIHDFRRKD